MSEWLKWLLTGLGLKKKKKKVTIISLKLIHSIKSNIYFKSHLMIFNHLLFV